MRRREFIAGLGGAAVAWPLAARAQAYPTRPGSVAASEWDYRSAQELVQALQARRISSVELLEHTIARVEALDQRVNAVIVRDFDRAREAAKAADVAIARGERRPLLGIP